jgi:hypothetical protein
MSWFSFCYKSHIVFNILVEAIRFGPLGSALILVACFNNLMGSSQHNVQGSKGSRVWGKGGELLKLL